MDNKLTRSVEQKAAKSRLISAAFDIGTTYSGYAYSMAIDARKVVTNQTWISGGRSLASLKSPTCILLDSRGNMKAFGYEAEDEYAALAEDNKHHSYYYFRRFKMMLHNDMDLSIKETEIEDINGKRSSALKVFALTIRFLKDHLLGLLNNQVPDISLDDITFSITVPAIWNDRAKLFMREAALEAGIKNDQIIITLEPEAASVWCQGLQTEVTHTGGSARADISAPGTKYMIVDIGGGTADITVHEKLAGSKLREIHKASGGPWGGIEVDKAFMQFLTNIIGERLMATFKEREMADYLDILREFETKKRKVEFRTDGKIIIKMPAALKIMFEENGRSVKELNGKFGSKVEWLADKMKIDASIVKQTLEEPAKKLISHVRGMLAEKGLHDVRQIIMVGGFAESPYVQYLFKENFKNRKIIIPADCGLAVLKGAVVFGHNTSVVAERIARYSYGLKIVIDFDPQKHPPENRLESSTGPVCTNVFWKVIEEGQPMPLGYTVKRVGRPAHDYANSVKYSIVRSNQKNPFLTTESGCEILGTLKMDLDNTKTSLQNTFDQMFCFGDTEIRFFMKHHTTGAEKEMYLDF